MANGQGAKTMSDSPNLPMLRAIIWSDLLTHVQFAEIRSSNPGLRAQPQIRPLPLPLPTGPSRELQVSLDESRTVTVVAVSRAAKAVERKRPGLVRARPLSPLLERQSGPPCAKSAPTELAEILSQRLTRYYVLSGSTETAEITLADIIAADEITTGDAFTTTQIPP